MTKPKPDDDTPYIHAYAVTETGNVRDENQDAVRICDDNDPLNDHYGRLYAVADGLGGYANGAMASTLALESFFGSVYNARPGQLEATMRKAVQDANLHIFQQTQRLGIKRMGTTLTAISVAADQLFIAHVGDSRAYLIRDGRATLLTNDHTMVGDLVRMKVITPDKIRTHSQRSILNKCLGFDLFIQPDVTKVALKHGDMIVLCSDGVWSVLDDHEFAEIAEHAGDPIGLARQAVNLALERDSDDNLSVVAVYAERLARVPVEVGSQRGWGFPQIFKGRSADKA